MGSSAASSSDAAERTDQGFLADDGFARVECRHAGGKMQLGWQADVDDIDVRVLQYLFQITDKLCAMVFFGQPTRPRLVDVAD